MGEFTFTRLAKAVADSKYSVDAVEMQALQELIDQGANYTPARIAESEYFIHCFSMIASYDETDIEFVILAHEGVAYIDTVTFETEIMAAGPFKGKTVSYPVPDTFS